MTIEDINKYMGDCLNVINCRNVNFTTWDKGFISDIRAKMRKGFKLTSRQEMFLKKIWDKI